MKTAIVTGANSGIGKQTAQALAGSGYRVVMICRNREKAENARREIIDETGNDRIDILICDLSSMHQIKETAETIRETYSQIDRLVNNAGLLPDGERKETAEGLELTFAVNHMAYFLLTRELKPLLESTPSSRIINVASDASRSGTFNPDNLQLQKSYSTMKAYGNSKLFNIMFTRQLAKELEEKDVTTYSLHPGVVNTNFASESNSWFARFFDLGRIFMRSPEKGAETSIYLCLEEGIEHLSGRYFRDKKPVKPVGAARSDEDCKRLWEMSTEIIDRIL
jgi:NAD(P)-dependent dehydrogenase (short-subunit alcohol dehydrogenase family)